jgi:hypothetical protein
MKKLLATTKNIVDENPFVFEMICSKTLPRQMFFEALIKLKKAKRKVIGAKTLFFVSKTFRYIVRHLF